MKAVRDTSSVLTGGEGPKQVEALTQLLNTSDQLLQTPTAVSGAIISGALDPSTTPSIRSLAYQVWYHIFVVGRTNH